MFLDGETFLTFERHGNQRSVEFSKNDCIEIAGMLPRMAFYRRLWNELRLKTRIVLRSEDSVSTKRADAQNRCDGRGLL